MVNKKLAILLTAIIVIGGGIGIRAYTVHNSDNTKASSVYATSLEGDSNSESTENKSSKNIDKEDGENDSTVSSENDTNVASTSNPTKPTKPTEPTSPAVTETQNSVVNYKEFFKNDVFIGDSITDGISYSDILNEENVCAEIGININDAKNQVNNIAIQNPRNIYLLYGVNDMDDRTPSEWFVGQYRELVHRIKDRFPGVNIYVQSILPVAPMVEQKTPHINNRHINETNEGLKIMAKEENITYLNIASLLNENNRDLYESDGTHFKPAFYTMWLNYVANNVR